ncbi:S-layer homology domain-containing protein [Paenibacillus luteus]|uniref:S-layer homology domain-containing protein n=1 Tax=Paenibacillus luteus TaxID=2545753 RepID=UPI001F500820|nr:S-layer homology domain-containing protein [Paenibacillus luteus]
MMLMFTLIPSMAFAAEKPVFSINGSVKDTKVKFKVGSIVEIRVGGEDLKDMYGFELRLSYDANKLQFQKTTTTLGGFSIPSIARDGELTFANTKIGNVKGENGALQLATLQFKATAKGEAAIQLTRVKLVDSKAVSATFEPKLSFITSIVSENEISFNDIKNHWANAEIMKAAEAGWINGYQDGSFRPQDKVTRAQLTTMLSRALLLSASEGKPTTFKDAEQIPSYARAHVSQAVTAGIVKGFEDHTFRPQRFITRSEIAVMVMRVIGYDEKNSAGKQLAFGDAEQIQDWAYPAIVSATELGLVQGRGNNRFVPHGVATRAEAVVLILRLLDNMTIEK